MTAPNTHKAGRREVLAASAALVGTSLVARTGHAASMTVTVKTLSGETLSLAVDPTDTAGAVRARVEAALDLPPGQVRLVAGGRELGTSRTLGEHGITANDTLNVAPRFRGG